MTKTYDLVQTEKDKKRYKRVLLFSGGTDSFCYSRILQVDILLMISFGSKADRAEYLAVQTLLEQGAIDPAKFIYRNAIFNFNSLERGDATIPSRNAYLVLYAAEYGEQIIVGANSGDTRMHDKDQLFYRHMTHLLNHLYGPGQKWTEERRFQVSAPYDHLSKSELVGLYLQAGGIPKHLLTSYSCHRGSQRPCGACKSCFRKLISLINNGVAVPPAYFETDPFQAEWFRDALPLIRERKYKGGEADEEIIQALKRVGI